MKLPVRLAMRREGEWWRAYVARADTMEGATEIGSIRVGVVKKNPRIKQAFIELMQQSMSEAIRTIVGRDPSIQWSNPEAAPESERSGTA